MKKTSDKKSNKHVTSPEEKILIEKWDSEGLTIEEALKIRLETRLRIPIEKKFDYLYKIHGEVLGYDIKISKEEGYDRETRQYNGFRWERYTKSKTAKPKIKQALQSVSLSEFANLALNFYQVEKTGDCNLAINRAAEFWAMCKYVHGSEERVNKVIRGLTEYLIGVLFTRKGEPLYIGEKYPFREVANDLFYGESKIKMEGFNKRTVSKCTMLEDVFRREKIQVIDDKGDRKPLSDFLIVLALFSKSECVKNI